jgi:hypothetical protein
MLVIARLDFKLYLMVLALIRFGVSYGYGGFVIGVVWMSQT